MMALGIGASVPTEELELIASRPDLWWRVANFNEMTSVEDNIVSAAEDGCKSRSIYPIIAAKVGQPLS